MQSTHNLRAFTTFIWFNVALLSSIAAIGCSAPTREEWTELAYPISDDGGLRDYEITGVTPGGIAYDDRVSPVDEERLDAIFAATYACLEAGPDRIDPQYVAAHAQCGGDNREIHLPPPGDLVVVVAPAREACHTTEDIVEGSDLPDYYQRIAHKDGEVGTEACPYGWRALFRTANDGTPLAVVTPSLHMLGDVITRWATMCRNPWAEDFPLRACASPRTSEGGAL